MKPYKFAPYLKTTIWGGYQIAPFKGIYTAQPNIGESWEISAVPGHESIAVERGIIGDVDLGLNLAQLIDKYKGLLVGERIYKRFGNQFPLLVKFIDSRQDLSVQVHPDDKMAQKRHKCPGKTEMWYVVKADVGAKIYSGLSKSITPDDYERLVSTSSPHGEVGRGLQDVIATHESHQGDLYFLPAGRLHAIGAGNLLVEIQQTSDITYRVYDYGTSKVVGRGQEHIKLELVDNKSNNIMNGIAFGQSSQARYIKTRRAFDICYNVEENSHKRGEVQLQIEDIRPCE